MRTVGISLPDMCTPRQRLMVAGAHVKWWRNDITYQSYAYVYGHTYIYKPMRTNWAGVGTPLFHQNDPQFSQHPTPHATTPSPIWAASLRTICARKCVLNWMGQVVLHTHPQTCTLKLEMISVGEELECVCVRRKSQLGWLLIHTHIHTHFSPFSPCNPPHLTAALSHK